MTIVRAIGARLLLALVAVLPIVLAACGNNGGSGGPGY